MDIKKYCKRKKLGTLYLRILSLSRKILDKEQEDVITNLKKLRGVKIADMANKGSSLESHHMLKAIEILANKKIKDFDGAKWYEVFDTNSDAKIKHAIQYIAKKQSYKSN